MSEDVELTAADLAERWRLRSPFEYIDEAAAEPVGDEYATPDAALRWTLQLAWSDLGQARSRALNGRWSIECENVVHQIVGLTSLVGPLDWGHVAADLILDGWFERIHAAAGHPTPLTEADRARARALLNRRARLD